MVRILSESNSVINSFDANGNMTAKGLDSYSYDAENHLIQTDISGTVTQYRYDGLGDRYERTRDAITTRYILDTNTSLTNVQFALKWDVSYGVDLGNFTTTYPVGQQGPTVVAGGFNYAIFVGVDLPKGEKTLEIGTIFKNGDKLHDAYSGMSVEVIDGKAKINSEFDIVLLTKK